MARLRVSSVHCLWLLVPPIAVSNARRRSFPWKGVRRDYRRHRAVYRRGSWNWPMARRGPARPDGQLLYSFRGRGDPRRRVDRFHLARRLEVRDLTRIRYTAPVFRRLDVSAKPRNMRIRHPRKAEVDLSKEAYVMNAIELLTADHKKVKDLFEKADELEGGKKKVIFDQIKGELETHTHIEETIFYPAVEKYD